MRRKIGPFEVEAVGLGCMNLSHAYGDPLPVEAGEAILRAALERGVDHFDTAALYGFGANEELVGRILKPHRAHVMLASKGGMFGERGDDGVMRRKIDGRPETMARNCEDSLRRLGVEVIDLYYLHRFDKSVPIEESVGAMGELVRRGLVKTIGLSEVSAATLKKAHREYPITALQTEYSLWTRNPEIAVIEACRELGVAFVAFSPLARGFLAAEMTMKEVENLAGRDIRRAMPRFSAENYPKNLALLGPYLDVAKSVGCSPAQLALAWVLAKGDDMHVIPGTTNLSHLHADIEAAQVSLSAEQMGLLDQLFTRRDVAGERYDPATSKEVDTETFEDA